MNQAIYAAITIAVLTTPARADEVAFLGAGTHTCAEFGRFYQLSPLDSENVFFSWAEGFMSGLNAAEIHATGNSKNLGTMSLESEKQFLRSYCNDHPLAEYTKAIFELFSKFPPNSPVQKP
jgi:hypothetical protein